jgi:membrane protease YdiL (CAAX protease family)
MTDQEIARALSLTSLFAETDPGVLAAISPYFRRLEFTDGQDVVEECSPDRHLMILGSGRVGVYKRRDGCSAGEARDDISGSPEHRIASLAAGEVLGEMSFLEEGQGRSATIRADGDVELYALSYEEFIRFQYAHGKEGVAFLRRLAARVSRRLREQNSEKVRELERSLEASRSRAMMSRMISYVILLLFGYNLSLQMTMSLSRQTFYANAISFAIVAVFGLLLVFLAWRTGYGWAEYGLTLRGWKRSVGESLAWSFAVMGLLTAVKLILIRSVPRYEGLPLFGPFEGTSWLLPALFYSLLSPVQEFIARGVLQSSFERFYANKNRVFLSILISNALFSAAHVHLSSLFAATVFIPGFLWGYLYHRHRSILGVSISHIIIGLYAVYILRFVMMANM